MSRRALWVLIAWLVVARLDAATVATTTPGPSANPGTPASTEIKEITIGRFGRITLHHPEGTPSQVVLLASGDDPRDPVVATLAREATERGALVVEFDTRAYLAAAGAGKDPCTYAAADLEALSQRVQKQLALPTYRPPILIGYSSGATLAYAALAEGPPNTFRGAISLGLCPGLEIAKPLCPGHGLPVTPGLASGKAGFTFGPTAKLEQPWIVLQGADDQACAPGLAADLVHRVPRGSIEILPSIGHGFAVEGRWLPQFRAAVATLFAPLPGTTPPAAVADLPLIEVPVSHRSSGGPLAIILSGDGGWAGLDKELAGALAARGIPTVGWNTLSYFWTARTPEGMANDLARVLRHYQSAWQRNRVLLIGYSYGADVLSFMASRLPADLSSHVAGVALLAPSPETRFEFHVTNWLGSLGDGASDQHPVLPEVKVLAGKLPGVPLLCLYGEKETDSLCPEIRPPLGKTISFSGAHHFGGGYGEVADRLVTEFTPRPSAPAPK